MSIAPSTNFAEHPGRNCADADDNGADWFPNRENISATREATKLCHGCPVIEACLRFALDSEWGTSKSGRDGIYGATTPAERFALETRIRARRSRRTISHGTTGGAREHRRQGDAVCEQCREAEARAIRERRATRRAAA